MATSGNVRTNTAFGYVDLSWSTTSQSIENNTSTINYTLSIYRSSSISSSAEKAYSININGSTVASGNTTIGGSGTKTIKSGTVTIPHKADGTKTFAFSFSQQIDITWSGSWIGTITGSGNGTLNTIPRATTPVLSASTVDMGSSVTITMNRASSAFTHTLEYSFGSATGTIGTALETSKVWTPALTLANQIPNSTSGTATITCRTYNGSTLIGTKSVSLILKVPSSVVPVINSVTRTEGVTSPDIATLFGGYVQHNSKIKIVSAASGAYSSTIQSYTVTLRDANATGTPLLATYYGNDITTDILNWETTKIRIGVIVTDSRGRSASVTYDETVSEYTAPVITAFSAYRSDASGNSDYDGTNLKITVNFEIATVNNLNGKYYEILYKVKGAASWAGTIASGNIYSRNESFVTSGITFSGDNGYELRLNLYDTFKSAIATVDIPTAFTLFDCRSTGKGIAFGKVSEEDAFEVAMDSKFTGQVKVYAPDSNQADSGFLRLYRDDGTLAAFLATSDNGNGVNLHLYQGGAWSGQVKISPTGQIIPSTGDSVIEVGTSNGWTYRKWNSGRVECWLNRAVSGMACNTAVGSWFRTSAISFVNYPFAFVNTPCVQMYFTTQSGTGGIVWTAGANATALTTPDAVYIIRMSSAASITGTIGVYASGRWR